MRGSADLVRGIAPSPALSGHRVSHSSRRGGHRAGRGTGGRHRRRTRCRGRCTRPPRRCGGVRRRRHRGRAVVERSIIGAGARIGPRALIRDGVIGDGADIGARASCCVARGVARCDPARRRGPVLHRRLMTPPAGGPQSQTPTWSRFAAVGDSFPRGSGTPIPTCPTVSAGGQTAWPTSSRRSAADRGAGPLRYANLAIRGKTLEQGGRRADRPDARARPRSDRRVRGCQRPGAAVGRHRRADGPLRRVHRATRLGRRDGAHVHRVRHRRPSAVSRAAWAVRHLQRTPP